MLSVLCTCYLYCHSWPWYCNGREFDPGRRRTIGLLVLGWVTVFGRVISHPGQLSLLPSLILFVGRAMINGQRAVMRCGWGSNTGWFIPFVFKCVGSR